MVILMMVANGLYRVVTSILASYFLVVVEDIEIRDAQSVAQFGVYPKAADLALLAAQLTQLHAKLAEIKFLLHKRR